MEIKDIHFDTLAPRFLKYVSFDTQSDENSETCPSAAKELKLAEYLTEELRQMGLKDVEMTANGYVYATLEGNTSGEPAIGFVAHMDTSPDAPGTDVKPREVLFDGGDIVLNEEKDIRLSPSDYPEMMRYKGQRLIVTDGTTLLGADDKAGVAEIMSAVEYLKNNPGIKHGDIKVAFTPDEEIGRGADLFDVKRFGADFAYTMDGGEIGELEYENFNAAAARVTFRGRNIHPGSAKGKMVNAMKLAMEFNAMLPVAEDPEHTEGREGFFHLTAMEGTVEHAQLCYIIRDHSEGEFLRRKKQMADIAGYMERKYGRGRVELTLKDQYRNMMERIAPVMHIVERARRAMKSLGIEPREQPVRGGTDGATLSFMGLPCPNIFAGGHNFHGRFEYVPVESMQAAARVIIAIVAAK